MVAVPVTLEGAVRESATIVRICCLVVPVPAAVKVSCTKALSCVKKRNVSA